jgi:DNA polymerase/3'-5' exonuclease PolX
MSDKVKFPFADGLAVARVLCAALEPVTTRLIVAGSMRRRKDMVGDVEILFVPRFQAVPFDLFGTVVQMSLADDALAGLLENGTLAKRLNVKGSDMWGEQNKLARHVASGIPVDLFTATEANWFNYLVCRTGPGQSNIAIASAAKRMGWQWNPYGVGFSRGAEVRPVASEREVFEFVGLPYREPWER